MSFLRTWREFVVAIAVLTVLAASVPVVQASIIQSTPSLPPNGGYTAPPICVNLGPGVCIVGATLHGFTGTTRDFNGMGEAIDSSITLNADVYTDVNNMPGTLIGPVTLQGPIGIFYDGRMTNQDLGTWLSSLTELDLTGTFHGRTTHTIEIILNPNMTSSGPTTVEPFGSQFPDGEYQVTSFFDVFAELSLDHGAFMQGPMRTFTLTPEPGTMTLLGLGLLGVGRALRRRKRV